MRLFSAVGNRKGLSVELIFLSVCLSVWQYWGWNPGIQACHVVALLLSYILHSQPILFYLVLFLFCDYSLLNWQGWP